MAFANDDIRFLYDKVWSDSADIAANPEAEPDDHTFQEDVHDLIRWRKGEIPYPFFEGPETGLGSPGFLDVGLPLAIIGNGFPVIDARDYVSDTGGYRRRDLSRIQRISVHHSVTREPLAKEDELALLREIGAFHVNVRGWPGYAYHFTVAPSGRPYYTGDMATTRYIVGDDNPYNVGICLLGNFTDTVPTDAALWTLKLLIGEIGFSLGRDIPYYGHRDTPGVEATACPGATYDQWLYALPETSPTTVVDVGFPQLPTPGRPFGPRAWTHDEIVSTLMLAAGDRSIPAVLVVGAAIAESGLDQFAEHLGTWPDVSFGLGQQTVKWAPVGDGSESDENIALVKAHFSDPANAIPLLADKLAAHYHDPQNPGRSENARMMAALSKYNSNKWKIPASHKENIANYTRALQEAAAMIGQ